MIRWVALFLAIGICRAFISDTQAYRPGVKNSTNALNAERSIYTNDGDAPEIVDSDGSANMVTCITADDRRLRTSVGTGFLRGNTTFQIGGNVFFANGVRDKIHFPLSKLDFPLDTTIGSFAADFDFNERWNLQLGLSKHLISESGKTKDSDWGVFHLEGVSGFGPRSLDIYSESDTDLDLLIANSSLQYSIIAEDTWSLSIAAGYLHQNLGFSMSNLRESYPSVQGFISPRFVSGTVGTYDVTYRIPYLQGTFSMRPSEAITIEGGLAYSSVAKARDEGNWMLRSRTFRSRADGNFDRLYINVLADINGYWFVAGLIERIRIRTCGMMTQYDFGEIVAMIDSRIESDQTQAALYFGRRF